MGPGLAPYQPSQRYCVVDERRLGEDDLPSGNLMTANVQLERSRSLADLARLVEVLQERLGGPGEEEVRRASSTGYARRRSGSRRPVRHCRRSGRWRR